MIGGDERPAKIKKPCAVADPTHPLATSAFGVRGACERQSGSDTEAWSRRFRKMRVRRNRYGNDGGIDIDPAIVDMAAVEISARAMGTAFLATLPLCDLRLRNNGSDNDTAQMCSFCSMCWHRLCAEQMLIVCPHQGLHSFAARLKVAFDVSLVRQSWRPQCF